MAEAREGGRTGPDRPARHLFVWPFFVVCAVRNEGRTKHMDAKMGPSSNGAMARWVVRVGGRWTMEDKLRDFYLLWLGWS